MDWKKLGLAAVAYVAIQMVVSTIGASANMGYYTNAAYSALWSKVMMPGQQPPGAEFYLLSFALTLVAGAIFAYAYGITKHAFTLKKSFKSDRFWKVGLKFGLFLFLMTGLTTVLTMYLLLAIPSGLLLSWAVQSLVVSLAAGVAFAKILG